MKVINDWYQDQIEQALKDIKRVEENDGAVLVMVTKKFAKTMGLHR